MLSFQRKNILLKAYDMIWLWNWSVWSAYHEIHDMQITPIEIFLRGKVWFKLRVGDRVGKHFGISTMSFAFSRQELRELYLRIYWALFAYSNGKMLSLQRKIPLNFIMRRTTWKSVVFNHAQIWNDCEMSISSSVRCPLKCHGKN